MYSFTQETEDDFWEVEALYDLCFAPGREALSSYRFRSGIPKVAELCIVARDEDGILAGVIRYWPVLVDGHPVLLLGPVAVHPTRQGEGIAAMLIQLSLEKAAKLGWERVLLVGDEPYYRRFDFHKIEGVIMPPPTNPDRILAYETRDGTWDGVRGEVTRIIPTS